MSALIDDLTQSMGTLLASGQGILASTLRQFQAKMIGAIAVLEARARGNRIFYTAGVPYDGLGMEGDLGVNKLAGDFYQFTGGRFEFLFNARPGSGGGSTITPVIGSYVAQQSGQQTIPVPTAAVVYLSVGVVDPATGSLNSLDYSTGYTYTSTTLTILANVNVQAGETIRYQYLAGNASSGGNGYTDAQAEGVTGRLLLNANTQGITISQASSGQFTFQVPGSSTLYFQNPLPTTGNISAGNFFVKPAQEGVYALSNSANVDSVELKYADGNSLFSGTLAAFSTFQFSALASQSYSITLIPVSVNTFTFLEMLRV